MDDHEAELQDKARDDDLRWKNFRGQDDVRR